MFIVLFVRIWKPRSGVKRLRALRGDDLIKRSVGVKVKWQPVDRRDTIERLTTR